MLGTRIRRIYRKFDRKLQAILDLFYNTRYYWLERKYSLRAAFFLARMTIKS